MKWDDVVSNHRLLLQVVSDKHADHWIQAFVVVPAEAKYIRVRCACGTELNCAFARLAAAQMPRKLLNDLSQKVPHVAPKVEHLISELQTARAATDALVLQNATVWDVLRDMGVDVAEVESQVKAKISGA